MGVYISVLVLLLTVLTLLVDVLNIGSNGIFGYVEKLRGGTVIFIGGTVKLNGYEKL